MRCVADPPPSRIGSSPPTPAFAVPALHRTRTISGYSAHDGGGHIRSFHPTMLAPLRWPCRSSFDLRTCRRTSEGGTPPFGSRHSHRAPAVGPMPILPRSTLPLTEAALLPTRPSSMYAAAVQIGGD